MIFLGAANFGNKTTNHDIGGLFISQGGGFTSNKSLYSYYEFNQNLFVIHNEGVNDLYKTIKELFKHYTNEEMFLIMDDFTYPVGEWKVSSFKNVGHNLCKNIKKHIPFLVPKIHMIRIGIMEYKLQPLSEIIFKKIDKRNVQLISNLYKNVILANKQSGNNISYFKQIIQASVV